MSQVYLVRAEMSRIEGSLEFVRQSDARSFEGDGPVAAAISGSALRAFLEFDVDSSSRIRPRAVHQYAASNGLAGMVARIRRGSGTIASSQGSARVRSFGTGETHVIQLRS